MVLVRDWYTKTIVGYDAGRQCTAPHWLAAWDMAGNRQFLEGAQGQGLSRLSENGCQPTSTSLMRTYGTLGIHQVCTSSHHPKGHADTERVIRTLKAECIWLQEWSCPFTLSRARESWIVPYTEYYLHSALGYKPPRQLQREYYLSHGTQDPAA